MQDTHVLVVKASENCATPPPANVTWFDPKDDTTLRLVINVLDINDNPPLFVKDIFTGGVTTEADFGTEFMSVRVRNNINGNLLI